MSTVGNLEKKHTMLGQMMHITNERLNIFFISTTAALRGDEDKIILENIVNDGLCICSKDKKLRH